MATCRTGVVELRAGVAMSQRSVVSDGSKEGGKWWFSWVVTHWFLSVCSLSHLAARGVLPAQVEGAGRGGSRGSLSGEEAVVLILLHPWPACRREGAQGEG